MSRMGVLLRGALLVEVEGRGPTAGQDRGGEFREEKAEEAAATAGASAAAGQVGGTGTYDMAEGPSVGDREGTGVGDREGTGVGVDWRAGFFILKEGRLECYYEPGALPADTSASASSNNASNGSDNKVGLGAVPAAAAAAATAAAVAIRRPSEILHLNARYRAP
jgi:hypothetical protein